jgi:hypothetical protein
MPGRKHANPTVFCLQLASVALRQFIIDIATDLTEAVINHEHKQ